MSSEPLKKAIYTTGDAAKLCHVNLRTIVRWVERGDLQAYQLPGRGDKRILREHLQAFMVAHNMPLPDELQDEADISTAESPYPERNHNQILVVDDDAYFSSALQRVFKRARYDVLIAHNGFEAGTLLATHHPGVMTLDLHMPGMAGEDVLRFVRAQPTLNDLKVVIISAGTSEELNRVRELGADAIVPKPFSNDMLLALVAKLTAADVLDEDIDE
ncbi:MAG: response regulator [Vampirovibrionales bacterium]|nr:response regulator [Vampirovibrionales bacterium]